MPRTVFAGVFGGVFGGICGGVGAGVGHASNLAGDVEHMYPSSG
jgi:hypothetical protein